MIVKYTKDKFDECVALTHRLNVGNDTVRHYPTDLDEIKSHRRKRDENIGVVTLLYIESDRVIALIDCNTIESEKYLQVYALFIDGEYEIIASKFIDYLRIKFLGYKGHFVVSDFNDKAIAFLNNINASSSEPETMLKITEDDYSIKEAINIIKIKESEHASFINLHNKLCPDVYWHAELLLRSDNFSILVNSTNNEVKEYVVVTRCKPDNEIYFLHGLSNNSKVDLLHRALNISFDTSHSVIFAIEGDDDLELYKTAGFVVIETFITYNI